MTRINISSINIKALRSWNKLAVSTTFVCLVFAFAVVRPAYAVESLLKDGFTIDEMVGSALRSSPEVKSAQLGWQAAIEHIPQAGALDDPVIGVGYFFKSVETRTGPQEGSISLSQKIPYPGKLESKSKLAYKDAEISRLKLRMSIKTLIRKLKVQYYDLAYIDKAIVISGQNIEIADSLVKLGETAYSAGETLLSDTFRAQSQRAQLDYDLLILTEKREVVAGRINMLLNRAIYLDVGKPAAMKFSKKSLDLKKLYLLAMKNKDDLVIAGLNIKKSDEQLKLAKLNTLPNFKVGLNYINVGERKVALDSGEDVLMATFSANIPLFKAKNKAVIEEAKVKKAAVEQARISVRNMLLAEVQELYFSLKNLDRLVVLYDKSLVPQAYEAMRLAETWYREENVSFQGMLEARTVLLRFNLQREKAVSDYLKKMARLEELTGTQLGGDK